MSDEPRLYGIYLFVRDMDATLDFYRRLGLSIDVISPVFARAGLGDGTCIEFGSALITRSYDPNWQEPRGPSTNTINLQLASGQAVDDAYVALTAAGYGGHLGPIDAPWGSRFALLDDPNGNVVGLHGPRTRDHEHPVKTLPPISIA
jgi:catechol 2,3-dioxygenase-like lactoylglutathione lyase family enzyme